jgi:hypothetical protein
MVLSCFLVLLVIFFHLLSFSRFRLGFIAVVNRSQADINTNKSITSAKEQEKLFFSSHSVYKQVQNRSGTEFLSKTLNKACSIPSSLGSFFYFFIIFFLSTFNPSFVFLFPFLVFRCIFSCVDSYESHSRHIAWFENESECVLESSATRDVCTGRQWHQQIQGTWLIR